MSNVRKLTVVIVTCLVGFVSTALAEDITIVGTGSGVAVLKAVGEAFQQFKPEVTITPPKSIGSSGAIKAVGRGEYLFGCVAREIRENEKLYGLTYVPYAKNPIVLFVHPNAGVHELSVQQILDIYTGKITNWKLVGGNDAKIRVIVREEGDSSLEVLRKSLPGFKDITVTPKSKTTFSDPKTIAMVEKTAGSIAYGTYANAKNANVNILQIEGKQVTDLEYPYVGILGLVFKEENHTGNFKMFVEFATSKTAHEAIKEAGGLPY